MSGVPDVVVVTKPDTVLRDVTVARVVVRAPRFTAVNVAAVGSGHESSNVGLFDFTHADASGILKACRAEPRRPNLWLTGVLGHSYHAFDVTVRSCVDGFGVYDTHRPAGNRVDVRVQDCDVDELAYFVNDPNHGDRHTHNDALQIQGGTHVTVVDSRLHAFAARGVGDYGKDPYRPATTGQAVAVTPNVSPVGWLHVEGCDLDGGAQPVTLIPGRFGKVEELGTFVGNVIGRGGHSPRAAARHPDVGVTWKDNRWRAGGEAAITVTRAL